MKGMKGKSGSVEQRGAAGATYGYSRQGKDGKSAAAKRMMTERKTASKKS